MSQLSRPGRRFAAWAAPFVLIASCALACASPPTGKEIHLVVLHTNDVHGQVLPRPARWRRVPDPPEVGGLPRIAAFVSRVRSEHVGPGRGVLVVDAGDWYQGTPEGSLDGGRGFLRALVAVGYDSMTLGNHEFDRGLAPLRELLSELEAPAICANLVEADTGEPVDWVEPWRVVEVAGVRIALVGLLSPLTPEMSHPDTRALLRFDDPAETLTRARRALAERSPAIDLILPVTHLGVEGDRRLAAAHPDLPLIIGGHSHTFLEEGARVGSTLIVQAGGRASSIGRVDLRFDAETLELIQARARAIELEGEPEPAHRVARVEELCAELEQRSREYMDRVVGRLSAPLVRTRTWTSSPADCWIVDAMRRRTGADVALHNRGGTRADLPAGEVTRRQLFELMPFDNDLVTMTLSGAEIASVFEQMLEGGHSGLDFSGIAVRLAVEEGDALRLLGVEIDGEPIDPRGRFRLTTNSFLADGGDAFEELVRGGERERDPILLRDMLEEDLRRHEVFAPPSDDRYRVEDRR